MQSKAATVDEYLNELPEDRRTALLSVRQVILRNLDPDVEEGMSYGMIGYSIPHRIYPAGYHCNPKMPLPYAGLASQKNHMSIHLCTVSDACAGTKPTREFLWFRDAWLKTGKKLDMGVGCIRFKNLDDLPLELIGEAIRRVPARTFIEHYEKALAAMRRLSGGRKAAKPAKASGRATPKNSTSASRAKPAKSKKKPSARSKR